MSTQVSKNFLCVILVSLFLLAITVTTVHAQNSSLYRQELPAGAGPPVMLQNGSWTYRKPPPPRQVRVHDIISIRVDERSQSFSEGEADRRKVASYEAVLEDWLKLNGIRSIKPAQQSDGDPSIKGSINQLYRAEGEVESRESVKFDIAAEIVDIRPNGNLVLEAHRIIRNNDQTWEYSLNGVCRREDIGPNNVLLSQDIAELSLLKRERGSVRDSYRRGWLLRLMDISQWF